MVILAMILSEYHLLPYEIDCCHGNHAPILCSYSKHIVAMENTHKGTLLLDKCSLLLSQILCCHGNYAHILSYFSENNVAMETVLIQNSLFLFKGYCSHGFILIICEYIMFLFKIHCCHGNCTHY